jgi:hypothetical protein
METIMPRKASVTPPEKFEQIRFVTWLKKQGYRVAASANGGSRNVIEARSLKMQGVSPGYPDLIVPLPRGKFHAFYVEMKRTKGGRLSEHQVDWLNYLREQGYFAEVAHGFEEAKEMFLNYLAAGTTPFPAA